MDFVGSTNGKYTDSLGTVETDKETRERDSADYN